MTYRSAASGGRAPLGAPRVGRRVLAGRREGRKRGRNPWVASGQEVVLRRAKGNSYPLTHSIDRRPQRLDIRLLESPAEVPGRGRIGNHPRPDRVQAHLVVSQLFEILERLPAAQEVVGDVQDRVRLVVGLMHLQQVQALVDRFGQPGALGQQVHRPDPTRAQTPHPVTPRVVDIAAAERRFQLRGPITPAQPPLNSPLATRLSLLYS